MKKQCGVLSMVRISAESEKQGYLGWGKDIGIIIISSIANSFNIFPHHTFTNRTSHYVVK